MIQVKYEMLRSVKSSGMSVSEASRQFGFSRTAYYKIEKRFEAAGIDGLCVKKTGPKAPAKVTDDILKFADDLKHTHPEMTNDRIIAEIKAQKGVSLHKRSLQRERSKKNASEIIHFFFHYEAGIAYYEQFRPCLIHRSASNRAYATGIDLLFRFGLLHFLNKFKRKGTSSCLGHAPVTCSPASASALEFSDPDTQELIWILAGMIRSTGEFHATTDYENNF